MTVQAAARHLDDARCGGLLAAAAAAGQAPLLVSPPPRGATLLRRGKVRDVYALGDGATLLLVATDRLSAFDVVFPTPIPGKGRVLTLLSAWWFRELAAVVPNHFLELPERVALAGLTTDPEALDGRTMLVRRTRPLPIECVVRGRLEGSAWREYRERGAVMEHALPAGLALHDPLPAPIFTPTTKAEAGHDESITFDQAAAIVGGPTASAVRAASLALFAAARDRLEPHGILLADTKFEFGLDDGPGGGIVLIDEALTPDSSRFLVRDDAAAPGAESGPFVSLDKQFVRDWAERSGWDKAAPAPALPADVVARTSERYVAAARRILATSPAPPDPLQP